VVANGSNIIEVIADIARASQTLPDLHMFHPTVYSSPSSIGKKKGQRFVHNVREFGSPLLPNLLIGATNENRPLDHWSIPRCTEDISRLRV
jgi:hypothetical protein